MAARTTGELLLDLLDLADELPQASGLQDLLGQLRRAAKAERAAATKQIGELETERDGAVHQLAKANTERDGVAKRLADTNQQLVTVKDENVRLRDEVKHFEESLRAKKDGISSTVKATAATAKDNPTRAKAAEEASRSTVTAPTYHRPESKPTQPEQNDFRRHQSEITGRSRPPPSIANDTRRASTSSSSTITSNSTRRLPALAPGSDSYRPMSLTTLPTKRRRSPSSPTPDRKSTPPNATPVCGTCKNQNMKEACDGDVLCGRCEKYGHRMCVYYLCFEDANCHRRSTCDFLHTDQYDQVAEKDRRMVRKGSSRFEFVGGKGM